MLKTIVKVLFGKTIIKKQERVVAIVPTDYKFVIPTQGDIIVSNKPSHKWDAVDVVLIKRSIQKYGWNKVQEYYHPENHPDKITAWSDYEKVREIYIGMKARGDV